MSLEFINLTQYPIQKKFFEKILQVVRTKERIKENTLVGLVFVGKERIRDINKKYRGKNQITEALSFPFLEVQKSTKKEFQFIESKETPQNLGEIFLCPNKIKKQAKKLGRTFKEYLIEIFIHGLLHLLGYQHRDTKTTKRMRKREKEIINLCFKSRGLTNLLKKNKI